MLFFLNSTALESLSTFIWSFTDPPYKYRLFSYLVPSYKNLFLDPILPSQYIPIPLRTFRAWPPEKPGSTNCFHFCSHHFTETALLEGTY